MRVSIIIPCYNVENYVSDCLNSVLKQTYRDIEIICVNDGSKDNTLEILKSFKSKYPQIQIIDQKNSGAPNAMNNGVKLAAGSYLQFLAADDILLPNKIEHQVKLIQNHQPVPDFIAGNEYWEKLDGSRLKFHQFSYNPWIDLIRGTLGDGCSNLWNRESFIKFGMWDESLRSSQEAELLFRFLKNKANFIYDPEPLTIIRQRASGSISMSDKYGNLIRRLNLRLDIKNYLVQNNLFTDEIKYCWEMYVFNILRDLFHYDEDLAAQYFNQLIDQKNLLNNTNISKHYKALYKWLGFKKTEKIIKLLK